MPNHVENHIEFNGDKQQIDAMLNKIGSDEYGIGTIDFKKIINMPETLNIEAGSRTDHGLKAYREFIEVYTAGLSEKEALKSLENIPTESEKTFLRQRTDIKRDEWELGKTAWQNIRKYGAPTWYEWSIFKIILMFGLVEIPYIHTNLIRMYRVWILFADGC